MIKRDERDGRERQMIQSATHVGWIDVRTNNKTRTLHANGFADPNKQIRCKDTERVGTDKGGVRVCVREGEDRGGAGEK